MKFNTFKPFHDEGIFFVKLRAYQALQNMARKSLERFLIEKFLKQAVLRNKLLIFYFTNNTALMEFNAKKEWIKAELRVIYKQNFELFYKNYALIFKDIKAELVVLKNKQEKEVLRKDGFVEKSTGNFRIHDNVLKEKFLKLQIAIKNSAKGK
ncbi:hypothetical protein [Campylobacter sp. US33a]|uniref:hypothetical protein n=1 Tax=Campylobacter sp. US33a TaxID=2498120 RepID=UPI00106879A6|nr:hypothetical protein [Campylobacter sp. US33a]TEY01264.1 hypothetical protein ELQ16_07850 [Campylobacter sp. US33a]